MAFYRRNLPHLQEPGAEYFVTLRLNGSLPKEVVRQMCKEREELKKLYQFKKDYQCCVQVISATARCFKDC